MDAQEKDVSGEPSEAQATARNGKGNFTRYVVGGLGLILFLALTGVGYIQVEERRGGGPRPMVSAENKRCIDCHMAKDISVGAINDWKESRHAPKGIGCVECHRAQKEDADSYEHYGSLVSTLVTPKDCMQCHEKEAKEFAKSHHAKGAQFTGSLDNFLGNVVEGPEVVTSGCAGCHGSVVKVMEKGKLHPATWPNSGIGRVNPDGSKGTCAACHARHGFSIAQARQPENCGRCHMGPDHPQIEAYLESKHGVLYIANKDKMKLAQPSEKWHPGKDYLFPTCATCHMSATGTQEVTHDVGDRISWTLRPVVSTRLENYEVRRKAMRQVCASCHSEEIVERFFTQMDQGIALYNNKFGIPAKAAMDKLLAMKKLTATPFDEEIEWVFYELWHHEGRRARHGLTKVAPDFVHWQGFYEVAKHFYIKFLPLVRELSPEVAKDLLAQESHRWIEKGMTKEEIAQMIEFYEKEMQGQRGGT
ncbi:MAG: cytochrome C552 [Nitrospira sp.]|nr:MAG: cytochrome C552 [Nitrospira sp.]